MSHEEFVVLSDDTEFVMFTRGETGRVLTLDELLTGLLAAGVSRVQKNVDQWPDRFGRYNLCIGDEADWALSDPLLTIAMSDERLQDASLLLFNDGAEGWRGKEWKAADTIAIERFFREAGWSVEAA